jgi:hypothetical protein
MLENDELLLHTQCSVLKSQLIPTTFSASSGIYGILCPTFEADLEKQPALLRYLLLERVCYWHASAYFAW